MGNQGYLLLLFCSSIFFHLLLVAYPKHVTGQQDGVRITVEDFQALEAIKRELMDARGVLSTWNNNTRTGACSGSWGGIKCIKGRVVALQLPYKTLGGRISPKIGMLKELRKLSLHDNLIKGTIPSSLGSLPNLRGLYLFNNRLSGTIPPSLGRYSPQLQAIDFSNNLLSGPIPPTLASSLRIYRLNLSRNSLSGSIPMSFSQSSSINFIALEYNNLSGSVPSGWGGGGSHHYELKSLTLDHNSISGNIPHSLGKLSDLEELSMSHNKINGVIPDQMVATLVKLRVLDLSLNNFTGEFPASVVNLPNLASFNVSHNHLTGQVPPAVSKRFNSSSFAGNLQLCGFTGFPCVAEAPSPVSVGPSSSADANVSKHRRRLGIKDIILILVGALLAVLFVLCCVLLCCLIRKRTGGGGGSKSKNGKKKNNNGAGVAVGEASTDDAGGPAGGKLVLFDGPIVFTADDLLCATAEIMGKSPYGTVYKATLEDGNQVAVKRLREKLAKAPEEFEIEVAALGRIRNPNLLPLRAYYLGPKGEKLLVFDYLSKGSLSSFLHARGPETTVDWPTRMKVAIGITRGLNHLHNQENLVHGNLSSSEVYLDEQNNANISDYGIHRLMTETANTNVSATAGATGYRAPELAKTKKVSPKTDIYSLGVIILELLTGKSPSEPIDGGSDLPQWVASTVKEEWTNVVFDLELMRDVSTTGDEMLNTLKLALHLVDPSPDARPDVEQVLQQLEEINPKLTAAAQPTQEEPTV